MFRNTKTKNMIVAALLCAIGIVIPIVSPIKIILEPASFTLASHVAVFIAMFISPFVSLSVAIGTTIGFFIGGFPIVVVLRALSHVVFALVGAIILKNNPNLLSSKYKSLLFGIFIACIHGICEVLVVTPFYFGNALTSGYYSNGYVYAVILLVGIGTIVHSMIDYMISIYIWDAVKHAKVIQTSTVK